ncbi:MAG TPA: MYXO-CTERM sorting domain-containing protein [Polyangiaceae bacterium]|nr:MYXO-CTERM sorting domain-containing protein [Polyangiaceae bacterium]
MRARARLLCAALLLSAPVAHANGRFPLAQRFFEDAASQDRLVLSATFGLLISGDRGQNWYHVCESAFAFASVEGDALLEVMPDGTMVSGIFSSLNSSSDCGCSWQPIAAAPDDETIIDVAKSGSDGMVALVVKSGEWVPPDPPPPAVFRVDRSLDGGQSWTTLSELPADVDDALTLDVAPSEPSRLYVSALSAGAGVLLVSTNDGADWESRAIDGADGLHQPYIAAVHPSDAEVVYVRTSGWEDTENGSMQANDALHYTDDAGASWTEAIRRAGSLFGFALSPDAQTVLVGFGDPVQPARVTLTEDLGLYRASAPAFAFERVVAASVSCVGWSPSGLYACFDQEHAELPAGFALGFSSDPELSSLGTLPVTADAAFEPLLRLEDVRGPLACNSATCLGDWQTGSGEIPSVCSRLGAPCEVDTTSNVLECASSSGGTSGTGGTDGSGGASDGGTSSNAGTSNVGGASAGTSNAGASTGASGGNTSGGSSAQGATVGADDTESSNDGSGCGCRAPSTPGSRSGIAALVVMALLSIRKRNRRAPHA